MGTQSKEKGAENGAVNCIQGGEHKVRGSEVFVGGLQRNVTEEAIFELFSKCGEVAEIRIMKDHFGSPKGYCFVRFTTREAALKAQKEKNGTMLQGKKIGVTPSTDQDTLFLGNLRKEWGPEEVDQMVRQAFQDVQLVELAMPPSTGESPPNKKQQNRGFAFVHFASHAAAARAYRVAIRPDFMLGGKWRPAVDWAENEPEPDPDEMAKVKTAFVGNLPNNVKEDFLQSLFEAFGKIERVAISRKSNIPVGFVHFARRSDLDAAIQELDGKTIEGPDHGPKFKLQVSLAKPADKARKRSREDNVCPSLVAAAPSVKFVGALGACNPLLSGGAYGEYTDYVVAKNPRISSKQFPLTEVVSKATDPYELAILSLRPAVANKLLQIFHQGLATRQEVDLRALESLRDVPEHTAVATLDQFALSSLSDVRNEAVPLVNVINRNSKDDDDEGYGDKAVLSSISEISAPRSKARRELQDTSGTRDVPGRVNGRSARHGRSHARDSRMVGMGSAGRISVMERLNMPQSALDTEMLRYEAYGFVPQATVLPLGNVPGPLLHRMPSGVNQNYGFHSYKQPGGAAGHVIMPAMVGNSDRRGFKFDPFTGERYKFDPFTGKPLQTGPPMTGKFH